MYNEMDKNSFNAPIDLKQKKGESLEALASYLVEISGSLFTVERNLRTTTNEIDQIFILNPKGKALVSAGILDKKFEKFLGECKNYNKAIDVTYVGKFCSLLLTNQIKLGIMFSYYGVSGSGWKDASGLIKKFYLHKERLEDRYCIIDFSKKDFEAVDAGKNFLEIVTNKLQALQFDTDYKKFLSSHPAE